MKRSIGFVLVEKRSIPSRAPPFGTLRTEACAFTFGGSTFATGRKAHHCRSSSEIFPRGRGFIFCPGTSGHGAPSFTHCVSVATCASVSFSPLGGICMSVFL